MNPIAIVINFTTQTRVEILLKSISDDAEREEQIRFAERLSQNSNNATGLNKSNKSPVIAITFQNQNTTVSEQPT